MIQQTDSNEIPEVYAVTSRGCMPAVFVRFDGPMSVLRPVNSRREYSFGPDQILSVADAEAELHRSRVAYVARNYRFEEISRAHGRREVRCFNPAHPVRSSYILTVTKSRSSCTCPAFVKSAGAGCKHLEALASLLSPPKPAAAPAKKYETYTSEEW